MRDCINKNNFSSYNKAYLLRWALFFLCLPVFVNAQVNIRNTPANNIYTQNFKHFNEWFNGGLWYSTYNDNYKAGTLYDDGHVMTSYITMYRATHDKYYLQVMAKHAANILLRRDDYAGISSKPVWSTCYDPGHSNNTLAYNINYFDGLLSYPMADFAQIILNNDSLKNIKLESYNSYSMFPVQPKTMGDLAKVLAFELKKNVYYYLYDEKNWNYYKLPNELDGGSFMFNGKSEYFNTYYKPFIGRDLPLNMQHIYTRFVIAIGNANKKTDTQFSELCEDITRRVANTFSSSFKSTSQKYQSQIDKVNKKNSVVDSVYQWGYFNSVYYPCFSDYDSDCKYPYNNIDDVEHAAFSVDFVTMCYDLKLKQSKESTALIFDKNTMDRFSNTAKKIADAPMSYYFRINRNSNIAEYDSARYLKNGIISGSSKVFNDNRNSYAYTGFVGPLLSLTSFDETIFPMFSEAFNFLILFDVLPSSAQMMGLAKAAYYEGDDNYFPLKQQSILSANIQTENNSTLRSFNLLSDKEICYLTTSNGNYKLNYTFINKSNIQTNSSQILIYNKQTKKIERVNNSLVEKIYSLRRGNIN